MFSQLIWLIGMLVLWGRLEQYRLTCPSIRSFISPSIHASLRQSVHSFIHSLTLPSVSHASLQNSSNSPRIHGDLLCLLSPQIIKCISKIEGAKRIWQNVHRWIEFPVTAKFSFRGTPSLRRVHFFMFLQKNIWNCAWKFKTSYRYEKYSLLSQNRGREYSFRG